MGIWHKGWMTFDCSWRGRNSLSEDKRKKTLEVLNGDGSPSVLYTSVTGKNSKQNNTQYKGHRGRKMSKLWFFSFLKRWPANFLWKKCTICNWALKKWIQMPTHRLRIPYSSYFRFYSVGLCDVEHICCIGYVGRSRSGIRPIITYLL